MLAWVFCERLVKWSGVPKKFPIMLYNVSEIIVSGVKSSGQEGSLSLGPWNKYYYYR